jgi:integrase
MATPTKKTRRRWGTGAIWQDAKGYRARHTGTRKGRRFRTKQDAEDWIRAQNDLVKRKGTAAFSITGDDPELTFGGAWKSYEELSLPNRHARSARDDRTVWKRLSKYVPEGRVQPFWQVQRIRELRQGQVDDYKARRNADSAAPDTLRLELALLRRLANWCDERGLCSAPRVKWRLPVSRARKADPVDEATYKKLLKQANPMQIAMLTWYWCTGCRPSELTAIRRADFDPGKKLVTIPSLKTGKRTGVVSRLFPLERPELIRVIKQRDKWWRSIAMSGESVLGCAASEAHARLQSEWLFPGKTGERIAEGGYAEALVSSYNKAEVTKVDILGYRHAFATRFLQKGGDALTLAKLMGTSMSMIERTYGHLMMEHAREVLRRV